jgi:hypothetical protein
MDGTTVRVQHGFSFWIFSGGVSLGLTNDHLTIAIESGTLSRSEGQRFKQPRRRVETRSHEHCDLWLALALLMGVRGHPKP